jgi:hypothetical protein
MSRRHKRIPRPVRLPTLVALHLAPEVGITERISVDAIAGGWATPYHFDVLADCRDLLAIAARRRDDAQVFAVCELGLVALQNIKDRYVAKHRLGATGDELQALRVLLDVSDDFWRRQGGETFRAANEILDRERSYERKSNAAHA